MGTLEDGQPVTDPLPYIALDDLTVGELHIMIRVLIRILGTLVDDAMRLKPDDVYYGPVNYIRCHISSLIDSIRVRVRAM